MLDKQRELICEAFEVDKDMKLTDVRAHFRWYASLEQFTIERDGLKAFIKRLSSPLGSDAEWLESVISFLGQLPSEQWTDALCREVEFKLADYSSRLLDLQKLYVAFRDHKSNVEVNDIDVYVLKSVKLRGETQEQVIIVDKNQRERIDHAKKSMLEMLREEFGNNPQHIKAVLAELVNESLSASKSQKDRHTRILKAVGGNDGDLS